MKDKTITVWFSCGAASAVAAKKTIELYGQDNHIRVVNNPIIVDFFGYRKIIDSIIKFKF